MDKLECESIDCDLQGESSQVSRMNTTKRGLGDAMEQAIACITAFRMPSG